MAHTVAVAMLTGSGFGNDALLPHPAGKQDLADGVVDLMRPRMVQVFPLQKNVGSIALREPWRLVKRARTAGIVPEEEAELRLEIRTFDDGQVGLLEILHTFVQDLGDVGTAEFTVESIFVNHQIICHRSFLYGPKKAPSQCGRARNRVFSMIHRSGNLLRLDPL